MGLLAAAVALASPATGAAKSTPKVKLRSVGAPPSSAAPGASFTLRGQLVNTARSTQRPKLTVTLRKTKTSRAIKLTTKTLARVKAGRTLRYTATVKVPASLAEGSYYVRTCVSSVCKFSAKRLTVRKPAVAPAPKPTPVTPGATATPTPVPTAAPAEPKLDFPATSGEFDVLVFRKGADATVTTIRELGKTEKFGVAVTSDVTAFTEAYLKRYRAVVFAGTSGDVLSDAQQREFEAYFKEGGGFLALGDAIDAEPDWAFLTGVLGARAKGATAASAEATIKVADRGHVASRTLPQYWKHTDAYPNFDKNVRGVSHVLATVDETTYAGGTMGCRPPDRLVQGLPGRPLVLLRPVVVQPPRTPRSTSRARSSGPVASPTAVYSDCGATVVANYQQTKISAPPNLNEPIGFDIAAGRPRAADGPRRPAAPARPGEGRDEGHRHAPGLHELRGRPLRPGDRQRLRHQQVGLPVLRAADRQHHQVRRHDGRRDDARGLRAGGGRGPVRLAGPVEGLLPALALQVRRRGEPAPGPRREQKILQVDNDRGACCHVAR